MGRRSGSTRLLLPPCLRCSDWLPRGWMLKAQPCGQHLNGATIHRTIVLPGFAFRRRWSTLPSWIALGPGAVAELDDTVGEVEHYRIVGSDDRLDALGPDQIAQQGRHCAAGFQVELTGLFVGQKKLCVTAVQRSPLCRLDRVVARRPTVCARRFRGEAPMRRVDILRADP